MYVIKEPPKIILAATGVQGEGGEEGKSIKSHYLKLFLNKKNVSPLKEKTKTKTKILL